MSAEIESIDNYTTLDELPQTYIDAVLSVEDKRFYSHPGIDPIAIGRALVNDIKAGAYVEGGSTITQPLAKNQYFTQDKKIVRKIAEMFMAFKIESVLDKDKILELYVNSIFFGNNYTVWQTRPRDISGNRRRRWILTSALSLRASRMHRPTIILWRARNLRIKDRRR